MPIPISSQVNIFLYSIFGGLLIGLIFDLFRIKRKAIKTGRILLFFEDLFFWLLVAMVMFSVVYYSNDGEIRGFIFLGTLLGVVLYGLLLSRAVMKSSMAIISVTVKIFQLVCKILSFPIKIFLKLMSAPSKYAAKKTLFAARTARSAGKGIISSAVIKTKIFLNARKKT